MPAWTFRILGSSALSTSFPIVRVGQEELDHREKAHVIGGGSRKRKVYHITEAGRAECESIEVPSVKKVGELLGSPPSQTFLRGRFSDSRFEGQKKLILTLPGIGKTSLLRGIADELVRDGKIVRFATMESFKDIVEIFSDWSLNFSSETAVLNSTKMRC